MSCQATGSRAQGEIAAQSSVGLTHGRRPSPWDVSFQIKCASTPEILQISNVSRSRLTTIWQRTKGRLLSSPANPATGCDLPHGIPRGQPPIGRPCGLGSPPASLSFFAAAATGPLPLAARPATQPTRRQGSEWSSPMQGRRARLSRGDHVARVNSTSVPNLQTMHLPAAHWRCGFTLNHQAHFLSTAALFFRGLIADGRDL